MASAFTVEVSGDIKALKSLDRQINYAAKQATIEVAKEAQTAVIESVKATFHVRGSWLLPSGRYGIHVRFNRERGDLSARIETAADWLDLHETGGVRLPGRSAHLTVPQVGAARPTIGDVVPTSLKARRILPNFARIVDTPFFDRRTGKIRLEQHLAGRVGKTGNRFALSQFFVNRKGTAIFQRLPGDQLKLFYTLAKESHIRKQSTVVEPTFKVVELRFGPIFQKQLTEAIKTAI